MWPFSRKKREPPPPPEPPAPPAPPPETELERLQREVFERVVDGKAGPAGIDDWRLQIYAGMYESRTHDALIEDVPHTAKLLGGELAGVVKRYVAQLPSTHYSLARLGHGFATWLRANPAPPSPRVGERAGVRGDCSDASEHDHHHHAPLSSEHATRPDLADLAELEWARSESFVADSFTPVEPETVQQMGPERFTAAWMQFVPSLRLLETNHKVTDLWKAMEAGEPPPPPEPGPERLIVWRKGFEVFHVAVAEDEFAALRAAQARETVAQICERFASRGDDAAHAAFQAIGSWLNEGMIAALREPAGPQDTFGL